MNNDGHIAVAWGSPGGATAEISNAIEELIGKRLKPIRLGDLAGPNETIQLLLNIDDWILIAKAVAAIYGAEIVKEFAKSTWKVAVPKLSQAKESTYSFFVSLTKGISNAMHANAPVVFGLNRTPINGRRHIGIEINDSSPQEIGRIIAILAHHGPEIENKLDEWDQLYANKLSISYTENSDCSVKIILADDGAINMQATVFDNNYSSHEKISYELASPAKNK